MNGTMRSASPSAHIRADSSSQRLLFLLLLLALVACNLVFLSGCRGGDDYDAAKNDNDATDDDDDTDHDSTDDDDDLQEGPYYQDFLQYWHTMDEGYAYFIEKNIDWDAVYEIYEPLAFAEADLENFQLMIAKITASLRDSHTYSTGRLPVRAATGVCLERIGEKVYVSRLAEEAEITGLKLGDEIVLLDGEPVDAVLERATSWEGCSSPHCCDFWRLPHVERYSSGEETVTYRVLQKGVPLEFTLERSGGDEGACKSQPLATFLNDASGSVLRYKMIDEDIGYIHLSTLSDSYSDQILAELEQALALFTGTDGIIFDARYNHGGSDLVAMSVLARFLDRIIVPVAFRYKNGPEHDDFTAWIPEPILPGSEPVEIPVVFLINGACISAADFFVAAASYVPTFTLMGTTLCGATGAPKHDTLPASGITYYYSQMQRKYLATGEQVEGNGIAPDILIELDPEDLVIGIDTQIEAAIEWLRENMRLRRCPEA